MKRKLWSFVPLLGLIAAGVLLSRSPDGGAAAAKPRAERVSAEQARMVEAVVEHIERECGAGRCDRLENAFAFSLPERIQCLEEAGHDPVKTSLAVLAEMQAGLDWRNFEAVTYDRSPGVFDVRIRSVGGKKGICLSLQQEPGSRRMRLRGIARD